MLQMGGSEDLRRNLPANFKCNQNIFQMNILAAACARDNESVCCERTRLPLTAGQGR